MQVIRTTDEIKKCIGNRETAVALGAFDGLHIGHRAVIGKALKSGFTPVVFTFQDNPAVLLSGKCHYLTTVEERLRILESWGVEVVVMPAFADVADWSAQRFLEMLRDDLNAKVISCGTDFSFGKYAAGKVEMLNAFCAENEIKLHVTEPVCYAGERVSATRIREALRNGEAEMAAEMLGRPFGFAFTVVHGNHLGRTIGIPTINQAFPPSFILPRFGVYASAVYVGDKVFCGVTNVGVKPTVGSDNALSETWMPDFSGDLYGQTLRLELLGFIRDERKFASLEELRGVIHENAVTAKEIFEKYQSEQNKR